MRKKSESILLLSGTDNQGTLPKEYELWTIYFRIYSTFAYVIVLKLINQNQICCDTRNKLLDLAVTCGQRNHYVLNIKHCITLH